MQQHRAVLVRVQFTLNKGPLAHMFSLIYFVILVIVVIPVISDGMILCYFILLITTLKKGRYLHINLLSISNTIKIY